MTFHIFTVNATSLGNSFQDVDVRLFKANDVLDCYKDVKPNNLAYSILSVHEILMNHSLTTYFKSNDALNNIIPSRHMTS